MLKTLLIAMAALVAAVLAFAATRPDSFRVARQATINAPAEQVFPLVNDFHRWTAWSPYERRDPALKRSYSGPASGVGASYAWEGNSDVGQGRMTITESVAPSQVTIQLDFLKPFEAKNVANFTLKGNGPTTTVTWAMHGPSPYVAKLMGMVFDMDSLIGKDFETGLAQLKAEAEKAGAGQ